MIEIRFFEKGRPPPKGAAFFKKATLQFCKLLTKSMHKFEFIFCKIYAWIINKFTQAVYHNFWNKSTEKHKYVISRSARVQIGRFDNQSNDLDEICLFKTLIQFGHNFRYMCPILTIR